MSDVKVVVILYNSSFISSYEVERLKESLRSYFGYSLRYLVTYDKPKHGDQVEIEVDGFSEQNLTWLKNKLSELGLNYEVKNSNP